jgi:hypothetical protein
VRREENQVCREREGMEDRVGRRERGRRRDGEGAGGGTDEQTN